MGKCPTMLTIKEAADRTGLTYSAVRRMCLQNRIVYIRVGVKYLVNYERLVDYLNGELTSGESDDNKILVARL